MDWGWLKGRDVRSRKSDSSGGHNGGGCGVGDMQQPTHEGRSPQREEE